MSFERTVVFLPSSPPPTPALATAVPLGWQPNTLPLATGHQRAQESKVLGGKECEAHSQPWQSALFQGVQLVCGAVLIADNWVITAAHCKKP